MAAPLSKTVSRTSSAGDSIAPGDDDIPQQAGRSPSGLAAQAAATAVHQSDKSPPAPHGLDSPSIPPSMSSKDSKGTLRKAPSPSSMHSPTTRANYVPLVSSPLNPQSPTGSTHSHESHDKAISKEQQDYFLLPTAGLADPSRHSTPGRTQTPSWPKTLTHKRLGRSRGLESSQSDQTNDRRPIPMTLHELGSDYSRYFNPFSDCRRSSFLSTPGVPAPSALLSSDESIRTAALPGASTTKLPTDPEMEKFFPLDDRLSAPYAVRGMYSFPLFLDEKEPDDDMHMPYPDDDVRFRPRLRDHFSRANICSTIGLIMMISGILFLFVVFPVLSYTSVVHFSGSYDTPIDEMPDQVPEPQPWATVNDRHHPLLRYMRRGLIDPDTPSHAKTRKSVDGSDLILVFSDEFNDNNRTFYPGDDPYFFAPDFWYGATQDLEWYDPDAVTTWDGVLELRLDQFDNHNLKFRSGMLNTWNQACFKGGVFEVSISLPGPAGVMGLWPGAWTMGNLGRPGYLATTEGMWPYTYDECDVGITPNQSMTDGTSRLPGQRLPACTCPGADHPTPGRGRGAPEIDIIEASADWSGIPVATQSYQVAPFDIWYYPDYEFTACPNPAVSLTNSYTGGPFQQAVSTTTSLNKRWFDGQAYQKYAFEYTPGTGAKGKISWFVGEEMVYQVDGRAIGPNGNVGSRVVSEEPMSIVLNLGISNSWVNIDWAKLKFPTIMRIDYVRWYQPKGKTMVTCDPPGFETTEYIKNHPEPYNNQNLTKWNQTGYGWPKNTLMHGC